jgi:hypothetical protein
LKNLGISFKAPFPDGNQVISGDLNLLDPVRKMSRIYRSVSSFSLNISDKTSTH